VEAIPNTMILKMMKTSVGDDDDKKGKKLVRERKGEKPLIGLMDLGRGRGERERERVSNNESYV
jgi:hypothetical protein